MHHTSNPPVVQITLMWRQTGTWDPWPQWSNTCPWTNNSLSYKLQINSMGLKATCTVGANYGQKTRQHSKKPNCHFWRVENKNKNRVSGAKAGYLAFPLHTTQPNEWAKLLSYPYGLIPGHTQGTNLPPSGSEQRKMLFVLTPFCCSRVPSKELLEFFDWTFISFYWLRKAKNPGWYQSYWVKEIIKLPLGQYFKWTKLTQPFSPVIMWCAAQMCPFRKRELTVPAAGDVRAEGCLLRSELSPCSWPNLKRTSLPKLMLTSWINLHPVE